MTTKTLTTLLERLERAGAAIKNDESVCGTWLTFPAGGRELIITVGALSESNAAILLGWAVGQIEAQGYRRQIDWYSDWEKSLWEVGVFKAPDDRTLVYGPAVFATELEATLQALAEILEAKLLQKLQREANKPIPVNEFLEGLDDD